ncbi:MAG: D-Ala-D-Ala carboxypeptidase family metallohydrolase [Hyphomicrobiales bacterium]|nr:D-Ala-D-Ala carboxypeptidase family metallohydrolase [Hyphomicrobiales bacterium]
MGQDRARLSHSLPTILRSRLAKPMLLLACSVVLVSCTSGGVDRSGLTAILTPDQQSQTTAEDTVAQADAAVPIGPRPSGVPKPRPSLGSQANGLEGALVPATNANGAANASQAGATENAQQNAEQLAATTEEPETKPLSLFARLTAPRSAQFSRPSQNSTPTAAPNAAAATAEDVEPETTEEPARKPTGIFANLFQNRSSANNRQATQRTGVTTTNNTGRARLGWNTSALPGVRSKKDLFGTDIDEVLELDQGVQLASVTNRARQGAHGLLLQRPDVKVGCFPRQLVRLIKQVERHFGRKAIVTSGFRSRSYNRLIRGARNSMHIQCKAADIQVQGVSKARLARYLRSLPGRGGVGTYCHTKSVHLDIGKKRDWNRRCRRRRARKS